MKYLFIFIASLLIAYPSYSQNECSGPLNLVVGSNGSGIPMQIQYNTSEIYCTGTAEGSIDLIVNGGSPTYSYLWNTGDTTDMIYNLMPGMYSVTVYDGAGCHATLDIPITEMTPLADQLMLAEYTECGDCYLSDGQSTYLYNPDNDYMVHIRDVTDGTSIENVEVCINVNDESYFDPINESWYLNRSFGINGLGSTSARSRVRLFFTEEELQQLAIDAGVTVIDTNTLSIQRFVHNDIFETDFDARESIDDITFNLFDNSNYIWEISFLETTLQPGQYVHYFVQLQNVDLVNTVDPEMLADANFYLIENPVLNWVQLESENFDHVGDGKISIVNTAGQDVYAQTFENRLLDYEKINVSDLPSGVYFLLLEFSDIKLSKSFKFVKI